MMTYPIEGMTRLARMKAGAGTASPGSRLPIGDPAEAWLRPVATTPARLDPADLRRLTEWRNRHVHAFLTEFEATPERTGRWLAETVGPDPTRILFMADDASGRTFGYMGLAAIDWREGYGEADAVVRGEEAARGTMKRCLLGLLDWARASLGLTRIGVRVRSDNPALEFYRRAGFVEVRREGLQRREVGQETHYVVTGRPPAGEPSLVHMIHRPEGA